VQMPVKQPDQALDQHSGYPTQCGLPHLAFVLQGGRKNANIHRKSESSDESRRRTVGVFHAT
jgi:hypothetical protein